MKTLNDLKKLCTQRALSVDCILKAALRVSPAEWWKNSTDQKRTEFLVDYVEQWSRTDAHIQILVEKFHLPLGLAECRSHAVGKQVAEAISSQPLFSEFIDF